MVENATDAAVSESVRDLVEAYELKWDGRSDLDGCGKYLFVWAAHERDVEPPATLPSIVHADDIYFLVPRAADLPDHWAERESGRLVADVARGGDAFVPDPEAEDWEWPDDDEIKQTLDAHARAVSDAREERMERERLDEARELLKQERYPLSDLYASVARVDETTPMLIEGLMRERGVSVFYGAFDEFKTTLVLDMMAHVAVGAPWQGRQVAPHPVIWYALEGADEIPVRLRALEARLRSKSTPWGDDRLPVTVRDRIPDDYIDWRTELHRLVLRWEKVFYARQQTKELPTETIVRGDESWESPRYPCPDWADGPHPVVVIDTLSLALGGDDEKGPRAPGFIKDCLDLLKKRPDLDPPEEVQCFGDDEARARRAKWRKETGRDPDEFLGCPVASHVVIIHHQTKTGVEFAGHRAIAANTHGLYRVHRFGKIMDAERPYAGQLTPMRVKGIPRPAPIRFEVDVVPVEGTKQTAAILKDKAKAAPRDLAPVIATLRQLENPEAVPPADLKECLDVIAATGAKDGAAKRKARQRLRDKLEAAGVLEPVEDDNGKVAFYRFHDHGIT